MYCSSNPILEDLYSEANHATTLLNAAIVTIHNIAKRPWERVLVLSYLPFKSVH